MSVHRLTNHQRLSRYHGLLDSKGRRVGGAVFIHEVTEAEAAERDWLVVGWYVRIQSTRDGEVFGAMTNSTRVETMEQAYELAERKFQQQEKRNLAKFRRGQLVRDGGVV